MVMKNLESNIEMINNGNFCIVLSRQYCFEAFKAHDPVYLHSKHLL